MSGVSIDTGAVVVPASNVDLIDVIRYLGAFHDHTPLLWFHWDQQGIVTSYDYKIKAVDGRLWTQVYDYADPLVPPSELPSAKNGGDGWSRTEINLHRAVREPMLRLHAMFTLVTLHATFS